ncbi:hypothetical protein [Laspinema olomoucense]|uniref:hypothetical protein n=1 Tax=Laspinema olomoucense TaxID=3231600 RepID=UPI0021BB67FD|nr:MULTISPECIES: hypothetical protein [unclassified Laspinema]MCT7973350.1 hypothetical protein [Laspinema sp. D3d]MCT7989910.1 hypothetical protein [Laspinema sp. D3a]
MALTPAEEEQVRQLLLRENAQKQKALLASKESLKEWLKATAIFILKKLTEAAIDGLIIYLKNKFGLG